MVGIKIEELFEDENIVFLSIININITRIKVTKKDIKSLSGFLPNLGGMRISGCFQ